VVLAAAVETDTALPLGRSKARALTLAVETDTAVALGRVKRAALGLAAEADAALPVGLTKTRLLGTATETDTALRVQGPILKATETDAALPLGRLKAKPLGTAAETDSAQAVLFSRTFSIAVGSDDDQVSRDEVPESASWPPTANSGENVTATTMPARKVRHQTFDFIEIIEALMRFDTSSLPDNAVVQSAVLQLQIVGVGNVTDRNLVVGYYPASNWPIDASGDYSGADNPGSDAGTFALTGFTTAQQTNLTLSSPSSISKTGIPGSGSRSTAASPPRPATRTTWLTSRRLSTRR
jgi:hypothetical protein